MEGAPIVELKQLVHLPDEGRYLGIALLQTSELRTRFCLYYAVEVLVAEKALCKLLVSLNLTLVSLLIKADAEREYEG